MNQRKTFQKKRKEKSMKDLMENIAWIINKVN